MMSSKKLKKKRKVFICDPAFCPRCGAILPLPGLESKVSCKVCSHKQRTAEFEGLEDYSCKYFTPRKEKVHLDQEAEGGPMVERQCPKCGHGEMTYTTQQMRSADEGQTVFYTCPKCKHKETENS